MTAVDYEAADEYQSVMVSVLSEMTEIVTVLEVQRYRL